MTEKSAKAPFHIPSLDGLRAISFLIVFVGHAGLTFVPGGFGVTIFFFLSGYLITTLLRLEYLGTGTLSFKDFYLRRVLRILPPFYGVLLLAVLLTFAGVLSDPLAWPAMLAQMGHITNYWTIFRGPAGLPAGTGVYWSLAVEEHFYLVFPCLFFVLQRAFPARFQVQGLVLFALCGVVLAWRAYLVAQPSHFSAPCGVCIGGVSDRIYMATDTRLDSILFGCALAVGANPVINAPRVSSSALRWVVFPLSFAFLLATFAYRAPWFREVLRSSLQGLALAPLFVVAIREADWAPIRLLNTRIAKRLGLLSYSLYLVHHMALHAVEKVLPPGRLLRGALALALSLAVAELVNRYIEKPCTRLRRKLAHTPWLPSRAPGTDGPASF